jgi:hypothetical protein
MAPQIEIWFADNRQEYTPGDVLECRYRLVDAEDLQCTALEASVLWYTEGKGEEDLLVHRFERKTASSMRDELLAEQVIRATLPNSPLSYDGVILKIVWCVRIKAFGPKGRTIVRDRTFRLGRIPPVTRLEEKAAATRTATGTATRTARASREASQSNEEQEE